jgi:hypothetical protein
MRKQRQSGLAGGSAEPFTWWVNGSPLSGGVGGAVAVELEQVVGRCD